MIHILKIVHKVVCAVMVIFYTGCAAIFNGSSQQAYIRSNMDDALLYVNGDYLGKGNGVATFKKKKNYIITVRKENCGDRSIIAKKSWDATALLGLLIDYGIISILVVDGLVTGAWKQFDQTSFVIDPICENSPKGFVREQKN